MREHPIAAASWTMAIFGALAFVCGAVGIVWPEGTLALLGCERPDTRTEGDYTLTFATASSMAASSKRGRPSRDSLHGSRTAGR